HVLRLGVSVPDSACFAPLFVPEDAYGVDMKIDDGRPGTGRLIIQGWDDCTDAADETDTEADYALGNKAAACVLSFTHAF
ncbi:MAG: hypothetical protein ACPG80_05610, partial [Rickettsiales bacterium]